MTGEKADFDTFLGDALHEEVVRERGAFWIDVGDERGERQWLRLRSPRSLRILAQ
jgi:hypothetical protein